MKHFLACTSVSGCVTSFMVATEPYLQYLSVIISIAAGLYVFLGKKK